ncbi:Peroxisomal (S)-2-hydroxy-acid oxidase [Seminavis robusta]|uniref:Peroxisomal (S)-2-hydroxy-acid oxidase n=1 Tax=Seminavis robusta TaxID=568900 RepID=A0A9N8DN28_9STRA|nr:Peroxisomal (S)-2-hydroxy-acid oxidase [Seminavis robusta]|eukprot:Sro236_g095010.1 Peroxisomal (S)-2-hydroxy-acid oxidase (434) ;mRNA; r:50027-51548
MHTMHTPSLPTSDLLLLFALTAPTTPIITKIKMTLISNVNDYQIVAKTKLPKALYEYLASGTDDEQTLAENIQAFKHWYLRPRVMRPVKDLSTVVTLFGHTMKMPVFCSPAGVHALCEPEQGECATAKACEQMGILFGLSQHSTRSIEQVQEAAPNCLKFYQAYILKDRQLTLRLVQRAIRAGYQGIFLTVDSVRFGYREADARNGFNALPAPHRLVNYDEPNTSSVQSTSNNSSGSSMEQTYNGAKHKAWDQNSELMFEQNLSWADVRWLKDQINAIAGQHHSRPIPLIIKGVMTAEDAQLALQAGADGIMVSNHGGRQLDACLASIDALPEVVDAVAGRAPVLLDGGIRRGTDVVKALALGATAVGIGKPMFFALAVEGQQGVLNTLQMLQQETQAAMALCGCRSVDEITRQLVTRHPNGTFGGRFFRAKL